MNLVSIAGGEKICSVCFNNAVWRDDGAGSDMYQEFCTVHRPVAQVRITGLFRCCIGTAIRAEGTEGKQLHCWSCNSGRIIFQNGTWGWDREEMRRDYSKKLGSVHA